MPLAAENFSHLVDHDDAPESCDAPVTGEELLGSRVEGGILHALRQVLHTHSKTS